MLGVPQLVGEDRGDLVLGVVVHKVIEQGDLLALPKTRAEGVGAGGALGGVHDVDLLGGVAVSGEETHESVAELALGQGGELVEQLLEEQREEGGNDHNQHEDHKQSQSHPHTHELLQGVRQQHESGVEDHTQDQILELIEPEGLFGGLVEAVLLLNNEGEVVIGRQLQQLGHHREHQHEDNSTPRTRHTDGVIHHREKIESEDRQGEQGHEDVVVEAHALLFLGVGHPASVLFVVVDALHAVGEGLFALTRRQKIADEAPCVFQDDESQQNEFKSSRIHCLTS